MSQRVMVGVLSLVVLAVAGCSGAKRFDAAQLNDTTVEAQAGKYWKKEGWWKLPPQAKRVMVTEFSVEFVTELTHKNTRSGQIGLLTTPLDIVGVGKRKREFSDDLRRQLPTRLYEAFVAQLQAQGYEVVPTAAVTGHARFADLAGAKAGKSFRQQETGMFGVRDDNDSKKISVWPAEGLPVVDDGWFKAGSNYQAESVMAGELGADVALRVRMRVGIDDDGRAVMDSGSTARVLADFREAKTLKGSTYFAHVSGMLVSTQALRTDHSVIDSKEFQAFKGDVYTINSQRFTDELMTMYPHYARMATVKLRG